MVYSSSSLFRFNNLPVTPVYGVNGPFSSNLDLDPSLAQFPLLDQFSTCSSLAFNHFQYDPFSDQPWNKAHDLKGGSQEKLPYPEHIARLVMRSQGARCWCLELYANR